MVLTSLETNGQSEISAYKAENVTLLKGTIISVYLHGPHTPHTHLIGHSIPSMPFLQDSRGSIVVREECRSSRRSIISIEP